MIVIKFIVGGLARSATTWLSVFLTTDDCVCLHDPSATMSKEELEKWQGGICDTGLWYYSDWCKNNTQKFILIDRSSEDVNKALVDKGLPTLPDWVVETFKRTTAGYTVYFEHLFQEEMAEELWNYVYPEKPFNRDRWLQLKDIYISPLCVEKNNAEL